MGMNEIKNDYGKWSKNTIIDKGYNVMMIGTMSFEGYDKKIDEIISIVKKFEEYWNDKKRVSMFFFYTLQKGDLGRNHLHCMIGLYTEKYNRGSMSSISDIGWCGQIANFWKNYGRCEVKLYDERIGGYEDYMFRNFIHWDSFEVKFGSFGRNSLLCDAKELKNKQTNNKIMKTNKERDWYLNFVKFVDRENKKLVKKNVKDSLLDFINKEIKVIETEYKGNDLVLKDKSKPGSKVKRFDIRCWSNIKDGKRSIYLKCKNEKVYFNEEDAEKNRVCELDDISKGGVVEYLNMCKDYFENMENEDIKLYYTKKDKDTKEKEVKLIHDK